MDSTDLPNSMNAAGGGICPGTKDTCKAAEKDNIPDHLGLDASVDPLVGLHARHVRDDVGDAQREQHHRARVDGAAGVLARSEQASRRRGLHPRCLALTINIDDITFMQ